MRQSRRKEYKVNEHDATTIMAVSTTRANDQGIQGILAQVLGGEVVSARRQEAGEAGLARAQSIVT